MARRVLVAYAAAMIVAGVAWGWRAPLGWDEQRYYLPAAQFFAERGVALDYPMPMPPFALVVQGFVWRLSESVFVLRMLSTLAMIGAVAVVAATTTTTKSHWLLLMFGTFPAALLNAFSLKHHAIVLLCCVGAYALWERQRVVLASLVLAVGALTHQFTGAMIGLLVVLSLMDRRVRDAAILALSGVPLAILVFLWAGARPPMHEATFTGEPAMSGVQPAQIVVLLFMAGTWIAPAVGVRRWKLALLALPFTALWMHAAGLMKPASVYERLAGPVSSLIVAVTRGQVLVAAIAAGALAALGVAVVVGRLRGFGVSGLAKTAEPRNPATPQLVTWSGFYAVVMLGVPYFFESYYALFVTVGWVLLRREIEERPPWFPIAATLAGIGYVIVKGNA